MKNTIAKAAVFASALALAACGSTDETAENEIAQDTVEAPAVEESATAGSCTQEDMMAKARELADKMQGMASDPAAMQEMAGKLQEIQQKVQEGADDGSFGVEEACVAYDELLATL